MTICIFNVLLSLCQAYSYCSEHSPPLWETMIYVLGRMGQHKKALDLILTQRRDINQAIEFVQEHDTGLWDYLIDLSLASKDNVEELLRFASQHKVDPIKLIRKVCAAASIGSRMLLTWLSDGRYRKTW